ncbi:heme ABC transporter permease [Telmatospirillum siberiense]|uniref:Heme exporter protein C n=1 Tax=Telmatospirillum siberiense TaxID=382514 RepID=A0A2N3PVW2_9PROT|nr:heme ABC transporter permease [Telmatospirillum siberiense]PKU24515.1 heme transporter HemC [Telmatospirillum siberiense]
MQGLANPARFMRLSKVVQPWLALASVLLIGVGLYFALFGSPADYQQGQTVRIMYVHVPSAWLGMVGYTTMALASAVGLIWKHPLADLVAKAAAPIGASFTFLCLATGSLWGKPMWGTWWAWDARLTSMLILLFLYLGYMALQSAFDDPGRGARAAAILALAGFINVPIIKFSVDWWKTLHQPASLMKMSGPTLPPSMLTPLLLMVAGFTCFFVVVLLLRVRAEIIASKIRAIRLTQIHGSHESPLADRLAG